MADAALEALRELIRGAAAARTPVEIRGGGTKAFYGGAVEGATLSTTSFAGIVDYSPTELVVTARAGTPLAELEGALRAERQMLAFEPPHFAAGATLGGAVATGLAGPRRPYCGAVRDFVLGVDVIDGTGTSLSFGGRVMKNVAGFDVARLMTGALGTLGLITSVSLKCLPLPKAEATLVFACDAVEAIQRVNGWSGRPLPLSGTCHHDGRLWVRLSGAEPAVAAAMRTIGGEAVPTGAEPWRALRDHAHPFFTDAARRGLAVWRLSVRSTAPSRVFAGAQLIEWGGALRWVVAEGGADARAEAAALRDWAAANGGHATRFRAGSAGSDAAVPAFAPLDKTLLALHQRLKGVFDPQGILNRGRLSPAF